MRKRFGYALATLALAGGSLAWLPAPPQPVRVRTEAHIERSPEEVFAFVTTPANWPRWHPSSLRVSGAVDHPLAQGEQVTEDYVVGGREGRALWMVTERDAPRR